MRGKEGDLKKINMRGNFKKWMTSEGKQRRRERIGKEREGSEIKIQIKMNKIQ